MEMKQLTIESFGISQRMRDDVLNGHNDTTFIGYYEDAIEVMKYLLFVYDDTSIMQIKVEPVDWDGYDREYIVTLDKHKNVWCEPAYNVEKNVYLEVDTDCVYIVNDCNSAIIKKIYCNELYEVSYDLEDEYNEDCNDDYDDDYEDDECDGDCEHCMYNEMHDRNIKNDNRNDNKNARKDLSESKHETSRIIYGQNGNAIGFVSTWNTDKDGESASGTFTYTSSNEELVKRIAREMGAHI